jgi:hypothetical protein
MIWILIAIVGLAAIAAGVWHQARKTDKSIIDIMAPVYPEVISSLNVQEEEKPSLKVILVSDEIPTYIFDTLGRKQSFWVCPKPSSPRLNIVIVPSEGSILLEDMHMATLIARNDEDSFKILKSRYTTSGQTLSRAEFKDFVTSYLDLN